MEKLSGLLLDVYDDQNGDVLRQVYPTREAIPETVKVAHMLTGDERQALPDDMFALVMRDGDVVLRKYACIDGGNTQVSIDYFLKTREVLPEEAQKVAAANLLVACDWYKITPPEELQKVAGIGGAVLGLAGKAGGWIAKNPMKALGGAMTASSVVGAGQEAAKGLKNINVGEATRGFGNL